MYDKMFDFNNDGKLDHFEKAAQTQFIEEHITKSSDGNLTSDRSYSSRNQSYGKSKVGLVIGCLIAGLGGTLLDMGILFGLLLVIIGLVCMYS